MNFVFGRWDFCIYKGNVVEHLDGHTDILHIKLYSHWLSWSVFNLKVNYSRMSFVCLTPCSLQGYETKRFAGATLLEKRR